MRKGQNYTRSLLLPKLVFLMSDTLTQQPFYVWQILLSNFNHCFRLLKRFLSYIGVLSSSQFVTLFCKEPAFPQQENTEWYRRISQCMTSLFFLYFVLCDFRHPYLCEESHHRSFYRNKRCWDVEIRCHVARHVYIQK